MHPHQALIDLDILLFFLFFLAVSIFLNKLSSAVAYEPMQEVQKMYGSS